MPQTVRESQQKASHSIPIEAGSTSAKIDPQLADRGMAVAARELGVPARDRADPTLLKLCSQQVIDQIRMIEGRLPGRVTVLKRDDRGIRRLGRKENLARRDGRPNAKRDAIMQDAEEIHIRIAADDG